jgi:hypothetical protein
MGQRFDSASGPAQPDPDDIFLHQPHIPHAVFVEQQRSATIPFRDDWKCCDRNLRYFIHKPSIFWSTGDLNSP